MENLDHEYKYDFKIEGCENSIGNRVVNHNPLGAAIGKIRMFLYKIVQNRDDVIDYEIGRASCRERV